MMNTEKDILEQRRQARLEKGRRDAELMLLHKVAADALCNSGAAEVRRCALAQVDKWETNALCSPRYITQWRSILNMPIAALRASMLRDDAEGVALRQNTPFGFLRK